MTKCLRHPNGGNMNSYTNELILKGKPTQRLGKEISGCQRRRTRGVQAGFNTDHGLNINTVVEAIYIIPRELRAT